MGANQEGVHASVRLATGTSSSYLSDWHALFDANSVASGTWNERALRFFNTNLGTSYTSLTDAMNAFAISQGFPAGWNSMNSFTLSAAAAMLAAETQGLAIDFTDDAFFGRDGFYGSAEIKDTGTPANNYSAAPTRTASSLLTYTSPSVKMCLGPAGTLRYGAHNLALNSENINTGSFAGVDFTKSSSTTFLETVTVGSHHFFQFFNASLVSGATYTFTVDVSGIGRDWIIVGIQDAGYHFRYVNLSGSGSLGGTFIGAPDSMSVTSLGGGQYRIAVTQLISGTSAYLSIYGATADGTFSYAGDTAKGYTATRYHFYRSPADSTYLTTGASSRFGLPLEWSSAGVLQGALIEEARTNLCQYSGMPSNWIAINVTADFNNSVGPTGATEMMRLTNTGGNTNHRALSEAFTISASTTYTISCFVKAGTLTTGYFGESQANEASSGFGGVSFDLSAVTATAELGATAATITSLGNGIYRVTATGQSSVTDGRLQCATNVIGATTNNDGATLFFWGAQIELGSFATSYIHVPAASTVTRAADNISRATSAYPSTAVTGTMFLEYAMQKPNESVNDYLLSTELNSTNSIVYQHNYAFNSSVRATVNVSAGGGAAGAETKPAAYATVKAGLAFSAAGSSLVVNAGTPVAIANSAMPSSQPNLQIGGFNGNGLVGAALIKKIMMLPRKMSDAELQTLTT